MHILRKVAAILTGVAALIGGASIAAGANAADSTPFTTDELAKDQSITVQATNLHGSTFKAVPLAYYSQGAYSGDQIVSYDLVDAGEASDIDKALKAAKIDTSTSKDSNNAYDAKNPMVWIAANLYQTDSTNYPWSGKLRDFLDQLKKQTTFTTYPHSTNLTVATNGKSASADVKPGIYAIVDTTNADGKAAAIIALNGTGINGITKLANNDANNPWILGTVDYKANLNNGQEIKVSKTAKADTHVSLHGFYANAAIGSPVTFQLTSPVPNWTGYEHFRYEIDDTPDNALTFNPDSVKVTVDGVKNPLVKDTDYTVSQDPTSKKVTFKFGENGDIVADKANFPEGKTVTITYTMTLNKHAVSGTSIPNTAQIYYSCNPNNYSYPCGGFQTEFDVFTGHVNVLKTDMNNKHLANAEFDLLDEKGNAVNVVAGKSAGQYRLADADEAKAKDASNKVVTASDGTISIDGLNGTYELKETKSPLGSPVLADATFKVDGNTVDTVKEANKLASIDTSNTDQINVLNARNLFEMPKTGAAGILMNVIIALLLVAAGVIALLVHRHNVKKAASAK